MEDLQRHGLRQTRQRKVILEIFTDMDGHPSPEEIHAEIRRKGHNLGLATIYRTLKVLVEAGLARKLEFGDGLGRYERQDDWDHHLHMICQRCGKTFEAPTTAIGNLLNELAKNNAFVLHSHTTYLYGLCDECISASAKDTTPKEKNGTNE